MKHTVEELARSAHFNENLKEISFAKIDKTGDFPKSGKHSLISQQPKTNQ